MVTTGHRRWKAYGYGALVVALLCVSGLAWISWGIGSDVRAAGDRAVQEYGGDRVSALIAFADAPEQTLATRNRAVWALGQLGDRRALPALEKHYNGGPCDHSRMLCQRELQKAIALCRGGKNLSAVFWRHAFFLKRQPQ